MPRLFGLQVTGSSDCLSKTQVSAKYKYDVGGLTPAQCWQTKVIYNIIYTYKSQ